jgi:hypothetical protein
MAQSGSTSTSAIQTSEEEESHPVLIPGMDIFNRTSHLPPDNQRQRLIVQTREVNRLHGSPLPNLGPFP